MSSTYGLTKEQMRDVARIMDALTPFAEDADDQGREWGEGFHATFDRIPIVSDASTKQNPEPLGWVYMSDTLVKFSQNEEVEW